jgi:aminoglycoside phosphotransferase (APT) family kinase protein
MEQKTLAKVCQAFNLGAPMAEPSKVHGGLLHRMWKIKTSAGLFAVKQLSSDMNLQDEAIKNNYELSEDIAARFVEKGIPAVAALISQGKHVFEVEGQYFLVYPWVNGTTIDAKIISEAHALKVAAMLAKIHQINLAVSKPKESSTAYTTAHVLETLKKAEAHHCPFAADLRQHEQALIAINEAYNHAVMALTQHQVMTHGDLDQKNVLWDEFDEPILIDWEAATFVNPTYDLINIAFNWSGIITEQFDQALFIKMIKAYKKAGGVIDQNILPAAFDGACSWLHWLIYNVERACLAEASEQETIGIAQVTQTLDALLHMRQVTPSLLAALEVCRVSGEI